MFRYCTWPRDIFYLEIFWTLFGREYMTSNSVCRVYKPDIHEHWGTMKTGDGVLPLPPGPVNTFLPLLLLSTTFRILHPFMVLLCRTGTSGSSGVMFYGTIDVRNFSLFYKNFIIASRADHKIKLLLSSTIRTAPFLASITKHLLRMRTS